MYLAIKKAGGNVEARLLGVGIGWTVAHSIIHYGPSLWLSARTLDFEYTNIQNSIEANIYMLFFISLAFSLYIFTSKKVERNQINPLINFIFILSMTYNTIYKYLKYGFNFDRWILLAIQLILSIIVSLITKNIYNSYNNISNNRNKK